MTHNRETKACARCGVVRVIRSDRGLYCRDCAKAARPGGNAWMAHASCRDQAYEAEWWWPASQSDPMTPVAITICGYCKVRDLCLDYALQHREELGVWGGTMPEDRRRIRAAQRKAAG